MLPEPDARVEGSRKGAEPELIDEKKFIGFYTKSVNIVRIDSSNDTCFAKLKKIGELRKSILDKLNKMVRTGEVFDIIGALSKHLEQPELKEFRDSEIVTASVHKNQPCITVQMKGDLKPIEILEKLLKDILDESNRSKQEFLGTIEQQQKAGLHFWTKLSGLQISELLKHLESVEKGTASDRKTKDFIRLFHCIQTSRSVSGQNFERWNRAASVSEYGSYQRIADLNGCNYYWLRSPDWR